MVGDQYIWTLFIWARAHRSKGHICKYHIKHLKYIKKTDDFTNKVHNII